MGSLTLIPACVYSRVRGICVRVVFVCARVQVQSIATVGVTVQWIRDRYLYAPLLLHAFWKRRAIKCTFKKYSAVYLLVSLGACNANLIFRKKVGTHPSPLLFPHKLRNNFFRTNAFRVVALFQRATRFLITQISNPSNLSLKRQNIVWYSNYLFVSSKWFDIFMSLCYIMPINHSAI